MSDLKANQFDHELTTPLTTSMGSRNYKYEQERKLGKFFLLCL